MSDSDSTCSSPTLPSPTGSGKTSTSSKRCNKPQMEKKRRERINCSLNVLKQLVLEALKKDTSQYSKLEKADILEMTVKHLRDLQRHQLATAASNDVSVVGKYRAGFTECATEVTRYLGTVDGLVPEVRERLMSHLSSCVQRVHSPLPEHMPTQYAPPMTAAATAGPTPTVATTTGQTSGARLLPMSTTSSPTMGTPPTTRPIQIQIPVATSPASLPGAGVTALQLAAPFPVQNASPPSTAHPAQVRVSAAAAASPLQQVSAAVSGGPAVTNTAAYSAPAYIGAFQVIPGLGAAQGAAAAYMLPSGANGQQVGLLGAATPVYAVSASPAQQAQLQQMLTLPAHQVSPPAVPASATTSSPSPAAYPSSDRVPETTTSAAVKRRLPEVDDGTRSTSESSQPLKKRMTHCEPVWGGKVGGVKVAINDTLREEVWRPW